MPEPITPWYEDCARHGGVCDCDQAGKPCALKHTAEHRVETSTSGLSQRCTVPGCGWSWDYD